MVSSISGNEIKVPVLSGMVEGEGSIYLAPILDDLVEIEANWDVLGPSYVLQTSPGNL